MIGEYRFFQDYFDGQIVKAESDNFKMFKVVLVSLFSAIGLFLVFADYCNIAEFILLELGMIWNIFSKLSKKISLVLGIFVGLLYFFFACNFAIYANALLYIACYIPFQLIAVSAKDYSDGDFVQVKKKITDMNKILFVIFFAIICVVMGLFSWNIGGSFVLLDTLSAALLVCSALLRNERYSEYYIFRVFALIMSIILWIGILMEYGSVGSVAIILMYLSYLIYEIVSFVYYNASYKNEYMLVLEGYQLENDKKIIGEKLEIYKKSKASENKNQIENKKGN